MQRFHQVAKAGGRGVIARDDLRFVLQGVQLRRHFLPQVVRPLVVAAAEVEAQHGMANRPVPLVVDGKPLEQRLVALEQLLARVEEEALAEAPRPRQKVVLALVEQPADVGGFVDVVAILFAELAEGLNARWVVCVLSWGEVTFAGFHSQRNP